jgi:hypothetical protein
MELNAFATHERLSTASFLAVRAATPVGRFLLKPTFCLVCEMRPMRFTPPHCCKSQPARWRAWSCPVDPPIARCSRVASACASRRRCRAVTIVLRSFWFPSDSHIDQRMPAAPPSNTRRRQLPFPAIQTNQVEDPGTFNQITPCWCNCVHATSTPPLAAVVRAARAMPRWRGGCDARVDLKRFRAPSHDEQGQGACVLMSRVVDIVRTAGPYNSIRESGPADV